MISKKQIHEKIISELNEKQQFILLELRALTASLENSAKSSAGDKHETSTSMNQLEQEQLTKQLVVIQQQQKIMQSIQSQTIHSQCGLGSFVKTNKSYFYISVGIGKITLDKETIYCINLQSPAGQQLKGKKVGNSIRIGTEDQELLYIS